MKEGRNRGKIGKEKGEEAREGANSKKSALERRQGWENKKIKTEEIRILSWSKAMERRTRRWEERWGSGEGKAKRGGEGERGSQGEICGELCISSCETDSLRWQRTDSSNQNHTVHCVPDLSISYRSASFSLSLTSLLSLVVSSSPSPPLSCPLS